MRSILRAPRTGLLLVLLAGALLYLPGFRVGFILDDYFHLAILGKIDPEAVQSPLALWSWMREGERPLFGTAVQGGWLPWWAQENLRIHFFRPLPSLLHWLDYQLYGPDARAWHATNLLLWILLLWRIVRLYREWDGLAGDPRPAVVLLAGIFFAVDEAHSWNTVWLAARHSLVAVLFSVWAVERYLRFRKSGGRGSLLASLLLLALGLLSSEVAVGALAWVAAHELALARERWTARLRAAAPLVLLVAIYVVLYVLGGFGSRGNDWYIDPVSEPGKLFTEVLAIRIPALLQGLLTPLPPEVGPVFGAWTLARIGQVVALLLAIAFLPWLRCDQTFRFVALGTLLSTVPTALAVPINYLLLLPSVGTAWLFAAFVTGALRHWRAWREARRNRKTAGSGGRLAVPLAVAVFLILCHGLLAPVQFVLGTSVLRQTHDFPEALILETELPTGVSLDGYEILYLNLRSSLVSAYTQVAWRVLHAPARPDAVWVISPVNGPHRMVRTSTDSFTLEIPEPGLLGSLWDRVIQNGAGFPDGSRFQQGTLDVRIERMEAGAIRKIQVTLDRPLDAPDVWLVAWNGERMAHVRAPRIGETVILTPGTGPEVR